MKETVTWRSVLADATSPLVTSRSLSEHWPAGAAVGVPVGGVELDGAAGAELVGDAAGVVVGDVAPGDVDGAAGVWWVEHPAITTTDSTVSTRFMSHPRCAGPSRRICSSVITEVCDTDIFDPGKRVCIE